MDPLEMAGLFKTG